MAVHSKTKQSWWRTLQSWWRAVPGIIKTITAFLTAIASLVVGLDKAGLLGPDSGADHSSTAPAAPAALVSSRPPPAGVHALSLPDQGADWQGFQNAPFSSVRCNENDPAVFIGVTKQSHLVVCRVGLSNNFYYKGKADIAGGGIQLPNAVPMGPHAFDVTNTPPQGDGTKYQIRPDALTVLTPDGSSWSEPMEHRDF
jgi:hypothetical protein